MAEMTPEQRLDVLERQVHKHMVSIAVLSLLVIGLSVLMAFTVFVGTLPWITPKRIQAEEILAKKAVVVKSSDKDQAFVYLHSLSSACRPSRQRASAVHGSTLHAIALVRP